MNNLCGCKQSIESFRFVDVNSILCLVEPPNHSIAIYQFNIYCSFKGSFTTKPPVYIPSAADTFVSSSKL